jgi:hypothetical protein
MQSRTIILSQSPGSQPKLLSPEARAPELQEQGQLPRTPHLPVTQVVTSHPAQQRLENLNGLAPVPEKPTLATSTNVPDAKSAPDKADATSAGAVSRAVEDDSDKDANSLAKENERTKMSFLLN